MKNCQEKNFIKIHQNQNCSRIRVFSLIKTNVKTQVSEILTKDKAFKLRIGFLGEILSCSQLIHIYTRLFDWKKRKISLNQWNGEVRIYTLRNRLRRR